MVNETREVNSDITLDDLAALEEATDALPNENEEVKDEQITEEPEAVEETKTEEPKEEVVAEPVIEPSPITKEVPGETPRERALREEVTRLRIKQREKEQAELLKNTKPADNTVIDNNELIEMGYDEDQIKGLEKVIDVLASRKGYVKKGETYQDMANQTLNSFIEEHPEYAPENDKDDINWNRFNSILKSDYKLDGKTNKELLNIFNKVHRDVKSEFDTPTNSGKIQAQRQKISSVSAGTSAPSSNEAKKEVRNIGEKTFVSSGHPGLVFKGFEEDDLTDI